MAMLMMRRNNALATMTERLFHTEAGSAAISALFGVALAFMFQKVCKGAMCYVTKSPPPEELNKYVYDTGDGKYYKYTVKIVECNITAAAPAQQI